MPRTPQDVTDAELAILQVLWDRRAATVRQLVETLYPERTSSYYATVQKLLERLEAKAFVRRDRAGWPHVFEPTINRDEMIGRQLQSTADRLCGGAIESLLTHLVRAKRLNASQRKSLRQLLDELDWDPERGQT